MSEKKRKVENPPGSGKLSQGVEVEILETTQRGTDVRLAAGAVLRIKVDVARAVRLDDQKDNEGNPVYMLASGNMISLIEPPTQEPM